jgi:hypothetical protein
MAATAAAVAEEEEASSFRAYAAAYHVPAVSPPAASTICVHRMRCTLASAMEPGGGGGKGAPGGGKGSAPTLCEGERRRVSGGVDATHRSCGVL